MQSRYTFTFVPTRVVGQGFFGVVQQGTWTVTSKLTEEAAQTVTREVAIKSIPRKIKTRDQCLVSNIPFIQVEVDILAKHRQHPFVNSLYAVIQERDQVHLVLQYCPGGDLFSLIQAYRLDIAQACPRTPETVAFFLKAMKFWACEIVVALSDLHASHIMHGDMKCENLLIDASGHIRVCDFGLSERHCQGNRVVARHGTELFMSPEQRQQKMLGLAVDAWALGYIFLHMFTLIAPRAHRDGDTENCNMEALRKSEPTTQFERDINNLIGRLLVVDRTQRATMPDVLAHDAFRDVNWKEVRSKSIAVPWIPATDADNFDAEFTALPVKEISAADCTVFTIIPARFS
jgi:serine/threonine protein kinase